MWCNAEKKCHVWIFICIKEPTEDMKKEAANAGIYESKDGQRYPKLQIHIHNIFNLCIFRRFLLLHRIF